MVRGNFQKPAAFDKFDAIIALGAVIVVAHHFGSLSAGECAKGLGVVALETQCLYDQWCLNDRQH